MPPHGLHHQAHLSIPGRRTVYRPPQSATVSILSAAIPHAASRRIAAPCRTNTLSRADVVPGMAANGFVNWCGWHASGQR
jgi:hypothetical protein